MSMNLSQCQNARSLKEYIARDECSRSEWFIGKGYDAGGIDKDQMDRWKFNKLIDNLYPDSTRKGAADSVGLTPRNDKERIAAWMLVVSPPKSVTVAANFAPAPMAVKIRDCVKEAADFAVKAFIEPTIRTRERKGKYGDNLSGNMMAMGQYHLFSRPVSGKPMMQDHIHYYIANASWDNEHHKGPRYLAAKLNRTFYAAPMANRMFHKRLRENLHRIGVETRGLGSHWNIAGLDRGTVNKFSPRRDQAMENVALGKCDRKHAGLHGRAPKKHLTPEEISELRAEWRAMLSPRELRCLNNLAPRPKWGRHLHPNYEPSRFDFMRYVERVKESLTPRRQKPEVDRGGPER